MYGSQTQMDDEALYYILMVRPPQTKWLIVVLERIHRQQNQVGNVYQYVLLVPKILGKTSIFTETT